MIIKIQNVFDGEGDAEVEENLEQLVNNGRDLL